PPPTNTGPRIHAWCADFETHITRGEAAAEAAFALKQQGLMPDLICAHSGWGESLFLKDVWPGIKLLSLFESYFRPDDGFINFDPEFPQGRAPKMPMLMRTKNAATLLSLTAADRGISATEFQKSLFPQEYHPSISVCHEGIDTSAICPDDHARINLPDGVSLTKQDEVITFVNRELEPLRGYHCFMRALPEILRLRPKARVLIVGGIGSGLGYGWRPPAGATWKQVYLDEVAERLDASRVYFLGTQPREVLTKILQVSSVHVYLTYPHVLSWSCLEAMSCGALLVGSKTAPVTEVVEHEKNGLLVDFFSRDELVSAVCRVFDDPDRMRFLREEGRKTVVSRFDLKSVCLPRQLEIATAVAEGRAVF
ncbi:MAG: glycosyltransferase, partial [Pseudomonadota bacterium]